MSHCQCRTRQNLVAGKRHIDIDKVDILRLALGRARQIERVDLHEHFFVGLLFQGRVDQFRALVQRFALARAFLDLGLQLRFSLGELAQVDTGRLTLGVGLEVDFARHGDRRRHGLTPHVDSLVETSHCRRLALTLGRLRLEVNHEPFHTAISGSLVDSQSFEISILARRRAALQHASSHVDNIVHFFILVVHETGDVRDDDIVRLGKGAALLSAVLDVYLRYQTLRKPF